MININLNTKDWWLDNWNDVEGLVIPSGERKVCPCGDTKLVNENCNNCTSESYFILLPLDEDDESEIDTEEYYWEQ
jgi:hypothetical protein